MSATSSNSHCRRKRSWWLNCAPKATSSHSHSVQGRPRPFRCVVGGTPRVKHIPTRPEQANIPRCGANTGTVDVSTDRLGQREINTNRQTASQKHPTNIHQQVLEHMHMHTRIDMNNEMTHDYRGTERGAKKHRQHSLTCSSGHSKLKIKFLEERLPPTSHASHPLTTWR